MLFTPSPFGRGPGEGLLQNETFIDLFFGRVSQQKEKRSGQAPAFQLSPHPDPLPKGEGILRRRNSLRSQMISTHLPIPASQVSACVWLCDLPVALSGQAWPL